MTGTRKSKMTSSVTVYFLQGKIKECAMHYFLGGITIPTLDYTDQSVMS